MEIRYNVRGEKRKELVNVIGRITGEEVRYLGVPDFNYRIGYFTVSKEGTLSFDDRADSKEIENLIEELDRQGFRAEPADEAQNETEGFTIQIPTDKVNAGNLTSIIDAKGSLIRKALGINDMPVQIGEDSVSFPWFNVMPGADEAAAYTHFISALCKMSVRQKRVTATERTVENEKYAFRCFLLRLGFIGAEYKTERRILLRNLEGNSAFLRPASRKEVIA